MQRGHAVDAVAADDGEGGHADALLAVLLDERHAPAARVVVAEARADWSEEPAVDLVDDLEVPRQHARRAGSTGHRSSASGMTVWLV